MSTALDNLWDNNPYLLVKPDKGTQEELEYLMKLLSDNGKYEHSFYELTEDLKEYPYYGISRYSTSTLDDGTNINLPVYSITEIKQLLQPRKVTW